MRSRMSAFALTIVLALSFTACTKKEAQQPATADNMAQNSQPAANNAPVQNAPMQQQQQQGQQQQMA